MSTEMLSVAQLQQPFDCILTMPGSKSHANRAIVMACLSEGNTQIINASPCDDVSLLVENLQKMNYNIQWTDKEAGVLHIEGGIPQQSNDESTTLFCGNAGTCIRFLVSVAAITPGSWIITGDEHMLKRPIGNLADALQELGADCTATDGCPPVHVEGRELDGGSISLDASKSSQYLTSLLHIGACLPQGVSITLSSELTSPPYVSLTKQALHDFGVELDDRNGTYTISPDAHYSAPSSYTIEGDWSAAGAFLVLAECTKSSIAFSNLDEASEQGDRLILDVMQSIRSEDDLRIDVTDFPDQLMNLVVLATKRSARTVFTGAANLRHKECDRLAVITQELAKVGISIAETEDGVSVEPSSDVHGATLDPHDDHRMAFCFAVLGSMVDGIEIQNPHCVSKSYPNFFKDLEKIHTNPKCIALTGMRCCGKSHLAEKLASALVRDVKDTDTIFEQSHGPIRDHIEKNGWESFRTYEEEIIEGALTSGSIVALGGGAIESKKTRAALQKHAITIWIQAEPDTIIRRLEKNNRPPLTDLPLEEEVPMIMKRREPLYSEVAGIELPSTIDRDDEIECITNTLQKLCTW